MTTKTDDDKTDDNVVTLHMDSDTGEIVAPNGKSLEQIADEIEADAEIVPGVVRGSSPQLTLDVGMPSRKPNASELKLKGDKFTAIGQWPQHKQFKALVEVEVEHVKFRSERDKDGYVVGRTRVHEAEIRGIRTGIGASILALCEEHGASEDLREALMDFLT